jgi:hypothetical protein
MNRRIIKSGVKRMTSETTETPNDTTKPFTSAASFWVRVKGQGVRVRV